MKVDIVIPSYNTLPLLQGLIIQIEATAPQASYVVVDNGSTDGTHEWLMEQVDVASVLNEENTGFAKACNQGAAAGEAEIVLFLNTDIELSQGWLEGVLDAFDDPDVAIAGAEQMKPDGQPSRYTNFISGACCAVRRDWFESVGGFDEQFFFGYDDLDLSYRAVLDGRKFVTTEPAVVHLGRGSHTAETSRHIEEAGELFRRKWMEKALKFVGGSRFLIGVPARDLTARDVLELARKGRTQKGLAASGSLSGIEGQSVVKARHGKRKRAAKRR